MGPGSSVILSLMGTCIMVDRGKQVRQCTPLCYHTTTVCYRTRKMISKIQISIRSLLFPCPLRKQHRYRSKGRRPRWPPGWGKEAPRRRSFGRCSPSDSHPACTGPWNFVPYERAPSPHPCPGSKGSQRETFSKGMLGKRGWLPSSRLGEDLISKTNSAFSAHLSTVIMILHEPQYWALQIPP